MKGIVFTEFLEMVESKLGADVADRLVDDCDLPSGGAYTSLGTYAHSEIVQMVQRLSELTRQPVPALLKVFGTHLMGRFAQLYPQLLNSKTDTFGMLEIVENYIHVEVLKLYPEAELPTIHTERPSPSQMVLTYHSSRPFADLAEGLIQGSILHYGQKIQLHRQDLEPGTKARFTLDLLSD